MAKGKVPPQFLKNVKGKDDAKDPKAGKGKFPAFLKKGK